MNKKLNTKGFGLVGILVVVAVVALVGFSGWLVWHKNHEAKKDATTSSTVKGNSSSDKTSSNNSTATNADPTAGWVTYTSTSGKFSLRYPKAWVTAANQSQCQDGIFLLGANSNSVGTCGTNNFGQMTITWQPVRTSCGLTGNYWDINSTKAVTVSGVSGTETTGTAKAGASVPEGTTTVQYCFIKDETKYVADYMKLSSYPDALSDFNLMVTKTLSFN